MHSIPLPKITRPQMSPVLVSIVILFLICTGSSGRAAIIYVSGSDTYQTIQAAVNAAHPGDEIIVRNGTYPENILADKSLNIHSENGRLTTFIEAADPAMNVIAVTADQVIIEGFSISGGTGLNVCGILLGHTAAGAAVGNCQVNHNRIGYSDSHKNCYGIYIFGGSNNILQDNIVSFNDKFGITLNQATHNHLTGNNCRENGLTNPHSVSPTGIFIYTSSNNDIDNNSCNNNGSYGIQLYDPDANNNCHNNYLTTWIPGTL
jgi:parallel beta-helix repeat protein